MGFGTVGSGVVELMDKNRDSIVERSGQNSLEVKYILDIRDFPDSIYKDKLVKDFNVILNDDDVKIVVETMGGLKPAYEFVKKCLEKGKSVVTSNKELVAQKGFELLETARKNNANFLFEASVGGGIPIIRPLSQCLAANEIDEIAGILNGTTNFILTKMINEGESFDSALKTAQELGYAEKDPTADVEGHDACRKICILASLAYGRHIYPEFVSCEGITKISLADVAYAKSRGYVIKLIANAKRMPDGKISACVGPAFVREHSQLGSVEDVFNAILVRGNATGDVIFYGKGAGKLPTASAVVADVIDCAKHTQRPKAFGWKQDGDASCVEDPGKVTDSFYIRALTADREKTVSSLNDKIGALSVLSRQGADENELAVITNPVERARLDEALKSISGLDVKSVIRITDY